MSIAPATFRVAEPERRFRAFVVDRAIAWTLFALTAAAAWWWLFRDDKIAVGIGLIVGAVLVVSLVFAVLLGRLGVSPGRAVFGLRVVNAETGDPIGVGPALLRTTVLGTGSLPLFGLGLATLAWTAVEDRTGERRGWHDHLVRSVVLDIRPVPVHEQQADERPRHVVNLTAMRLMPVREAPAPVVPAPPPGQAGGRHPGSHQGAQHSAASQAVGASHARAGDRPQNPVQAPAPSRPPSPPPNQPPPNQPPPNQPPPNPATPNPVTPPAAAPPPVRTGHPAPPVRQAPSVRQPAPGVPTGGDPERRGTASGPTTQARPSAGRGDGPVSDPHQARPAVPRPQWRLILDSGESFVVEGLGLVGRKPEGRQGERVRHVVPLISKDMSISKTHAQFNLAPDGALVVMDRGSTNGSLLIRRGVTKELSTGRAATLVDGDRVRFGDREIRVAREKS